MPGKAAKVVVTERQLPVLLEFSKSRSVSFQLAQRAMVIVLAFEGHSNEQISEESQLGRMQVGLWRRRWRDNWEQLTLLECHEPRMLRKAIQEIFRDAPRGGGNFKFTAEQVTQIQAVACEPPSRSERPITHWTRNELRDEVVKRGIVPDISESQVGRFLRDAALQPHRRKMWINTTEKDPEVFRQQAAAVCQTYLDAPKKSGRRHAYREH
jgi:putative transposase